MMRMKSGFWRGCVLALGLLAIVSPASAQVIKIATLAPEGSGWMRELRAAASEVQQGTAGRVQVKFYPGGVMGNDAVVLRKIRLGQLQGGVLTSSELSLIYPDAPVYSLPFLFNNTDEVLRARARVDPLLAQGFEARGFKMLGISGMGFAYVMSTRPLRTRADMSGIKLWIPQNDSISDRTFKLGGVSPIPLPLADVFTSLQTGMIDTVANTPSGAVALQWHGKLKHMIDLPLSYVVGFLVVDLKAWNKIDPTDRTRVEQVFAAASKRMDANVQRDDVSALAAMKKQGLQVVTLEADEARRWRDVGGQVTTALIAEKAISTGIMTELRAAVAESP